MKKMSEEIIESYDLGDMGFPEFINKMFESAYKHNNECGEHMVKRTYQMPDGSWIDITISAGK